MQTPALKTTLFAILGIGVIGALAADGYYTHELAQRIAGRPDTGAYGTAPVAAAGGQWDPWREMQRLQARMEQAFDRSYVSQPVANPVSAAQITLEQQPDSYIVRAVIPGAREGDIKVDLEGRVLSIASQSRSSDRQTAKDGSVVHEETYSGAFEEAFTLPGPVVDAGMKSDFRDGVLTLTIPRAVS